MQAQADAAKGMPSAGLATPPGTAGGSDVGGIPSTAPAIPAMPAMPKSLPPAGSGK